MLCHWQNDCRAMLTIEHKQQKEAEVTTPTDCGLKPGLPLHFASGLLGFEANKQFELISDDELNPFQWLNGIDADQSFLVIQPAFAVENYTVELSDDDVAMLGLQNQADAVVICIATYHPNGTSLSRAVRGVLGPLSPFFLALSLSPPKRPPALLSALSFGSEFLLTRPNLVI